MKIRTVTFEFHAWKRFGPVSEDEQLHLFPHGHRYGWVTVWRSPRRVSEEIRSMEARIRRLLALDDERGGGR